MERPTRVPGPLCLLGFFGRKPKAVGRETSPEREPELEEPEEMCIALPLGEGGELVECPLCLLPQPPEAFPTLASCDHRSCRACLEQYLRIAVSESRVQVACPHCPAALQPADIHRLLAEPALRDKYEEFLLRRLLVADPGTRWCPAPDCSYAVIAYGCAECPRLTCGREGCGTEFCYHCRQPWHPDGPCVPVPPAPSLASPAAQLVHPEDLAHAEAEDIKVCPRCSAFIMKINDGSCNRMNCTVCGCLFCWLCLQEISDVHFLSGPMGLPPAQGRAVLVSAGPCTGTIGPALLCPRSPSGCTFWGKRPWSRTRKILWQLGMVLGAPMVISLVAGIAVPVITIGIPIYMGRKVLGQSRRSSLSGCQQCLSVTSSVLLSLFVSPIITAVTVGVGVPLMLTYVYGVVVLSLCRSRWGCGGGRSPPRDLGVVELENLTKLNELWSVLPSPRPGEDGVLDTTTFPSSRHSPRRGAVWKEHDSQSASMVALAGSMLSEGQDMSYREGINIEVEVSIEAVPHPAREQSLCSALSGQSLSGDSLGGTSDRCSTMGIPAE
ncbi:E3 ubiquitin-protein ligase RNF19B-like isoform X1 [Aquila chrysaetos chrysaetos]|uniref:E3 ubiquitin-protein ligase RNF19B-like isoform X1 n=1 Tax=Aquila chrysaetos chrysaetos TaxID=223781 RepID=UPI001B7D3D97|nr:E3 ubiquitin-protein ligase RNF19B-like isoform X1 [Aquila chrysaetos chrysaetos]XP_040984843.1 E3 ubiquitin-protein ligase RNF19B-like isoform X1 [Aquila chrysaetos chrysaetos]XP_040984844.1 E3 ubiquitin-protein ligase RNF19B-like isoform X1 [Aquila chrysaetos chrysaetos]